MGIVAIEEARRIALERGFDLVEVSPLANPPVCKLADYGKFLYRQKKLEQKQKKMQKKAEVKGTRFSFRTGIHDLEVKANQARKFLEDRNSVKVQLIFRGREISHRDLAKAKMEKFAELLADVSKIETPPKMQGMSLIMTLIPLSK